MSTKDSPHHHPDQRVEDLREGPQAREAWEQEKLRELGIEEAETDGPIHCPECRREMLERLAKAQARGSMLFQIVRQQGLSPLPLHGIQPGAEGPVASAPALPARPRLAGRLGPRARRVVLVGAAIVALTLWAALTHLRPGLIPLSP
ncbi:hypothetical protein SOCEGT47_047390 [Sorangium cellulosum]|uniref:Uncharacterized protein n=1 Tax=Sorangium cellulosum TaxID=56 RepID=A0A4V0NDX6_SORCE|nr:hypothetical protein [Sorangium cellulosum]AUX24202.1 hypothetical protein SOCEGT47_047390 [Sorangium cellulosum]